MRWPVGDVGAVHAILEMLRGGDRRSIGRADEVVALVLAEPAHFDTLMSGMLDDDPVVRMRAADVAEKVTARQPELLQPYVRTLIEQVSSLSQQEVRWHVAQMLPRLALSLEERDQVVDILQGYLSDHSRIVRTMALQALADIAEQDPGLTERVIVLIEAQMQTGSPAVRSRGRRLLADLAGRRPHRKDKAER